MHPPPRRPEKSAADRSVCYGRHEREGCEDAARSPRPICGRAVPEGIELLALSIPGHGDLLDAFDAFVRTANDDEIVRTNAVRFGEQHGFTTASVVDLFLHARKLGLLTMEWQYVCPGCGDIVERLASLASATAHHFCQVCSADRDADLSDFIEVTFSLSPTIRRSRWHDPWSLQPEEYFFDYRFTQNGVVDDGTPLRDHLRRRAVACAYVEPARRRRSR